MESTLLGKLFPHKIRSVSLQEACLNIVVQNFESYFFAFSISNDPTLIRNLEFLQRVYTYELFDNLVKNGKLKTGYLDFLLNKYLKYFDANWFDVNTYQGSLGHIFSRLPNLLKINLSGVCNDKMLKNIVTFCPQVTEIDTGYSSITDTGLKYFCKRENGKLPCPYLKSIDICSCKHVTDEGVVHVIKNLPTLENINYRNIPRILYSLHKEDVHNLTRVPSYNLVDLDFLGHVELPYYTDLLKICLTLCPRLQALKLKITDEKQVDFFQFSNLKKLFIYALDSKPKTHVNIILKNNCCNLVFLSVSYCTISAKTLTTNCLKLQHLEIFDCSFIDDPDDSHCVLQYLAEFCIRHNKDDRTIDKALISLLSSSPNLERLKFYDCYLTVGTKTHILQCCKNSLLKNITFGHNNVEMRFLKDILFSCVSLKILNLAYCYGFSPDDEKELPKLVKLLPNKPAINVNYNRITDYDS